MNLVAGIIPFGIQQSNPTRGPTIAELDRAYALAESRGFTVRFVLLTNPNNPLGIIYRPNVILDTIEWARDHQLHTIVDEIYALSTHQDQNHEFHSVIQLLDNELRHDVHFLWAISKDFGASGLRCGVIYSQNEAFMEGLGTLNIFSGVSGPIQYMISELLTDDAYVDHFLGESRRLLRQSYRICTAKLEEMVIPYVPVEAGGCTMLPCVLPCPAALPNFLFV
jgi:aspartate/methionine/tyrosine aminotransferase